MKTQLSRIINAELTEFADNVADLCKHYFIDGDITTSDFQGGIDGLINKSKKRLVELL